MPHRSEVTDPGHHRPLSTYVAAIGVSTAGMLPVMLLGTLAVQMRSDLALSNTRLAVAVALYFLGSAVLSLRAGRWCEEFDAGLVMTIAACSSLISMVGAALAPSYPVLLLALVTGVVSAALSTPASNMLVAANLRSAQQGVAHGAKQAAIPLAGVLAGLAVPVFGTTVGWRAAFAAATAVPVCTVTATIRSTGRTSRTTSTARRDEPTQEPAEYSRALDLVAMAVFFAAAAVTSLTSFIVVASTEAGMSENAAGMLVAVASAVVVLARLVAGLLVDRGYFGDRLRPVVTVLGLSVVGYLGLALQQPWAMAVGVMFALGTGWAWPGLVTLTVVERHPLRAGRSTGRMMAGIYSGAVAGPLAFAAVEAVAGFSVAWVTAAGFAAAAATIMWFGRKGYLSA